MLPDHHRSLWRSNSHFVWNLLRMPQFWLHMVYNAMSTSLHNRAAIPWKVVQLVCSQLLRPIFWIRGENFRWSKNWTKNLSSMMLLLEKKLRVSYTRTCRNLLLPRPYFFSGVDGPGCVRLSQGGNVSNKKGVLNSSSLHPFPPWLFSRTAYGRSTWLLHFGISVIARFIAGKHWDSAE